SDMSANRMSAGQQTLDILYEMSQLLNTQLDKETLATCVGMIESGVNAEALAAVILELRREAVALNTQAVQGAGEDQQARQSRPPTRTGR
ncbi:mitotic-spindle organizing gamma-tubulin ring associated-domain-containing protein, partial [Vararia minispora EC-137]